MSVHDTIHRLFGNPDEFIKTLRSRMLLHAISSARLARRSGITANHLSEYLRGRKKPSMRTMVILDEALELLINER